MQTNILPMNWTALFMTALLFVSGAWADSSEDSKQMVTLNIQVNDAGQADRSVTLPCRIKIDLPGDKTFIPEERYDYRGAFTSTGREQLSIPLHGAKEIDIKIGIFRGMEYRPFGLEAKLKSGEPQNIMVVLERWVDMASGGWWSGDLHIHRPIEVMGDILLAEDLNLAPVLTVWNQQNLWTDQPLPNELTVSVDSSHAYHLLSLEDERGGGATMFYNLKRVPFDMSGDKRWWPDRFRRCKEGRDAGGWIEIEKPFWWETPVVMALGQPDSIGIVCNHFAETRTWDDEVWGRHRDLNLFPGTLGFAHNICDIYYRLLNLGFRIPPTAGAASGVLPNEIGGNRTYVYLGKNAFGYDAWWQGLKAGRCFSTNGPMLLVKAQSEYPGAELAPSANTEFDLEVVTDRGLASIELIADGKVVQRLELDGKPGTIKQKLTVDTRGKAWIAVRCFETEQEKIYFAHTGPFYMQGRERAEGCRDDAAYFIQWIDELKAQDWSDPKRDLTDSQRDQLMGFYDQASKFYEDIR